LADCLFEEDTEYGDGRGNNRHGGLRG
jgi:hypothetical protein